MKVTPTQSVATNFKEFFKRDKKEQQKKKQEEKKKDTVEQSKEKRDSNFIGWA